SASATRRSARESTRTRSRSPRTRRPAARMGRMLLTETDPVAIAVHHLEPAIDYYHRASCTTAAHRTFVQSDGAQQALLQSAESPILLLPPTRHGSPVAKAFAKRGEGLPHIGCRVSDCAAAFDSILAAGRTALEADPRPGSRGTTVDFVHPKGSFGTL